MEDYTLSSKTLKVEANAGEGSVEVRFEVSFLSRKGDKMTVFDKHAKTETIGRQSEEMAFRSKNAEDFYGWAVVARAVKDGTVIACQGSSYPVEQHVLGLDRGNR